MRNLPAVVRRSYFRMVTQRLPVLFRIIFFIPLFCGPKVSFAEAKIESINYPFSRIFTSPEQRAILDRQRYDLAKDTSVIDYTSVETEKKLASKKSNDAVTLSGIVVRNDGKHIVWINGKSELSKSPLTSVSDASIRKNQNDVMVRVGKRKKPLRAGQIWLVDENKVKESFEVKKESVTLKKNDEDSKKNLDSSKAGSEPALDVGSLIQSAKAIGAGE